jgi:outer membrane receptor for ferric coprogen and ferric-rhodotorulic acid
MSRRNKAPAACASFLMAASVAAQAESPAPSAPAGELPAVTVRASDDAAGTRGWRTLRSDSALGLNLSRRETPQSISAITQQQIEDFGLASVHDLLDLATGVHVERVETDRTYYTARGFDVTNFQFDGIGMPFINGAQWSDLDTVVFERVDILRGANGLLSSTGNPSATVNFVRKRPTAQLQASAALTVGSWNRRREELDVGGPLSVDGRVRARVVAAHEKGGSWLDRYGIEKTVVSGIVEADLGAGTRLSAGYTQQQGNADSPMWGALPLHFADGGLTNYAASTSTAAGWAWWNNTDRRAHAQLSHQWANGWQLKASALRRTLRSDSQLLYVYGTPERATGLGLFAYPSQFRGDYAQSSADLRASGPFTLAGRSHELLVGANWARESARERSDYGRGIGTPMPDLATWNGSYPKPLFDSGTDGSDFGTRRASLYAAARLNATDRVKVILGANATHVRSSGSNYGVAHEYDRSAVSPYAGITVALGEQLTAYASHTRIFNPQAQVDANRRVLDPIEGRSLEAGLKTEWLDKRLAASLALFRTRQANTAEAAGTFADFQTYYRGIDATATGFEAEITGRLAPGWEVNGGYTQMRLKDDATGADARTFVPRRLLRMALSWRPRALPALTLGVAARWQSAISTVDAGTAIRQGGYALLDLMARYEFDPQWSLAVNVHNATGRKYLTSLYWTQAYYGAPRNVSATLRYAY